MTADRHITLDAVRGFAVMGILLMNIVSMGMPGYAYVNPLIYGHQGPADTAAWAFNYVFADGKMRALFTMLFGASMVLIAERAAAAASGPGPGETHYRRMFWLFVFGMIHAWLIWYGDILVQYAVAGALGFVLWRAKPRTLWIVVALGLLIQIALNLGHWYALDAARSAALAPGAPAQAVAAWQTMLADEVPSPALIAEEVAGFRGGFVEVFETRMPLTIFFQTFLLPITMPELFAFLALGIVFYRNGFLSGAWSWAAYRRTVALGYLIAAPLTALLAWTLYTARFDIVLIPLTDTASMLLRPFIALAHAALVILLVQSGAARALVERLAAAGRMAFSNYLGTSIVTTTFFFGYGFGWFGSLSRWQLYLVVLGVWALILLWSKPWLTRYRYGPLEWLWRSLARGSPQVMRKAIASH